LKYTPEELMQAYLEGTLSFQGRAEFVQLMRQDPLFADRVAKALEEGRNAPPLERKRRAFALMTERLYPAPTVRRAIPWAFILLLATGFGLALNHVLPVLGNILFSAFHLSETQTFGTGSPVTQTAMVPKGHPGALNGQKGKAPAKKPGAATTPSVTPSPTQGPSTPATPEPNPPPVKMTTDKTQVATITVLDGGGQVIRHLYHGTWLSGEHLIPWDGRDDYLQMAPPADYTISVQTDDGNTTNNTVTLRPN
jgi:hypothetical protein